MPLKSRSGRRRAIFSGAAIGAAATAAAVKATLSGPLGVAAAPELDRLRHELAHKGQAVMASAKPVLDQAQAHLQALVQPTLGQPTTNSSTPSPGSRAIAAPSAEHLGPGSIPATQRVAPDAPNRADRSFSRALVRKVLREAAVRHGIDPKIVLALSYWESGWDQSRISETGAVGLMQVEPATAQEAGPVLLGRTVDLTDPYDNADVGVAIFRQDLMAFHDPALALAAYYQGPTSLQQNGMLSDSQAYADGILSLAGTMNP